jgi:hypothetical protein
MEFLRERSVGMVGKRETMRVVPAGERRFFWEEHMSREGFPFLAEVASRALSMHATSCAPERNWSLWGNVYTKARNRLAVTKAEKLIYIRMNSKSVQQGPRESATLVMLSLLEGDEEEEESEVESEG